MLGASSATDLADVRLWCLSILEEGSSVSGIRYSIRRIRKCLPEAAIVVGLWHADRDSTVLFALRSEVIDEHLVLSIGELLAFVRMIAMTASPSRPTGGGGLGEEAASATG